jgi:class 3 adenylate cyclase
MVDLPVATVVFDLSGSSLSIRNYGAKKFAAETQYHFKVLTNIIYRNHGLVEKFPGDGISMHFRTMEFGKKGAIKNAIEVIIGMDEHLNKKMNRDKYRFTLTYGEDTIITSFGSMKHQELISIGYAVNVAYKLEKIVKEYNCYIAWTQNEKKSQGKTYTFQVVESIIYLANFIKTTFIMIIGME